MNMFSDFMVNVVLGEPYEKIIQKIIQKGYAGTQAEVIRQALAKYNKELEEKEQVALLPEDSRRQLDNNERREVK